MKSFIPNALILSGLFAFAAYGAQSLSRDYGAPKVEAIETATPGSLLALRQAEDGISTDGAFISISAAEVLSSSQELIAPGHPDLSAAMQTCSHHTFFEALDYNSMRRDHKWELGWDKCEIVAAKFLGVVNAPKIAAEALTAEAKAEVDTKDHALVDRVLGEVPK